MVQLEEWRLRFEGLGINVAGMTYDSQEILQQFHKEQKLGYPLLQDENAEHVTALGIRNEDYVQGHRAYGIPHPGVLLIGSDGKILAKFAVAGFRGRPPFEDIYAKLKLMSESG
ncbi:MAG: peroxiredoxin [Candidatus Azotimanducaceae bacterium]